MDIVEELVDRWPILGSCRVAAEWLATESQIGLAPRTIDAMAVRSSISSPFVSDGRLIRRVLLVLAWPRMSVIFVPARLVAVRLFIDYLVADGVRATNPVGHGTTGMRGTRGLVPHEVRQPWVPSGVLGVVGHVAAGEANGAQNIAVLMDASSSNFHAGSRVTGSWPAGQTRSPTSLHRELLRARACINGAEVCWFG